MVVRQPVGPRDRCRNRLQPPFVAERSEGLWRRSPGSIYPALQQLAGDDTH